MLYAFFIVVMTPIYYYTILLQIKRRAWPNIDENRKKIMLNAEKIQFTKCTDREKTLIAYTIFIMMTKSVNKNVFLSSVRYRVMIFCWDVEWHFLLHTSNKTSVQSDDCSICQIYHNAKWETHAQLTRLVYYEVGPWRLACSKVILWFAGTRKTTGLFYSTCDSHTAKSYIAFFL